MFFLYLSMLEDAADKVKFEVIYKDNEQMVYNIAFRVTKNYFMAQSATQNSFVSIARNIKIIKTDNATMLKSYIYTIAENAAIDELRKVKRERKHQRLDDYLDLPDDCDLSEELVADECLKRLAKMIYQMPRLYSEVLALTLLFNYSLAEVSRILRRNSSTVRQQFCRGKKLLREMVKEVEENDQRTACFS